MKKLRCGLMAGVALVMAATTMSLTTGTATAPAQAASKPWTPTQGGKFNIARSTKSNELVLERQVLAAINHARRGSTISMAMFSFDRHPVADALIRAKRRGVRVRVIVNDHEWPGAQRKLRKRLGTKRVRANWIIHCRSSCRGQGDVQHSKFVLFSHTGAARNVVMLGSLNMKWNGIHNQFNDLLTLNNTPRLYSALDKVFMEMRLDRLANPSYLREDISANMRLYVLPFTRAPRATAANKWTNYRDPISQILRDVTCKGAAIPGGRTRIRVSMHAWDKERGAMIARQFRNLYAAGCDVKIEVGFAGRNIRRIFGTRTARGYVPIRSTGYDTDRDGEIDKYSHMKLLLINGNYAGSAGRKVVVTGSANYQNGGQYGDELIFRLYNSRIYNQYYRHWNRVYNNYTHGFGRASARMSVSGRMIPGGMLTDKLGPQMPDWRDE